MTIHCVLVEIFLYGNMCWTDGATSRRHGKKLIDGSQMNNMFRNLFLMPFNYWIYIYEMLSDFFRCFHKPPLVGVLSRCDTVSLTVQTGMPG